MFRVSAGFVGQKPLPRDHAFADVYAPIVEQTHRYNPAAVGLGDAAYGGTQKNVAQMAQMQRFVGIGRRIFHHDRGSLGIKLGQAHTRVCIVRTKNFQSIRVAVRQVQKALYHGVCRQLRKGRHQFSPNEVAERIGSHAHAFGHGKQHHGKVSGKSAGGVFSKKSDGLSAFFAESFSAKCAFNNSAAADFMESVIENRIWCKERN